MSESINTWVAGMNEAGRAFYDYAAGMFLQTAVLVAVLLCVDRLLRKRVRATLRYWIWMLVFVKLLLPPSLCIPTGIGYWLDRGEIPPAPAAVSRPIETPEPRVGMIADPPAVSPVVPAAEFVPAVAESSESVARSRVSLTWQGSVFLLWIVGVLVFAGLVVQRWRFVKGLIARSEPASEDWIDLLNHCRQRMNVRARVSLRLLPDACSPAVCGLLRPTILAPRALLDRLPSEGLQAVLIHELAHVKRGDLWINSLQTVLQAAYFYNPLVWLASAIVRRVREQAVDEMSLVALGAEARSYGNTLIDIAEMAFLRPSPALRLIGVAESRKSLEGRIKHMMTRPIPKSARVGVIGVLFVAAVGAILLPMATAKTETATSQFTANLPDGVIVEFVGICNWATGQPVCWKADGSPCDMSMRAREWSRPRKASDYGFLFKVTGRDDADLTWAIDEAQGSSGSTDIVDAQGNRLEGYKAITASIPEAPRQITVRVGLATGPWRTTWTHDGKAGRAEGGDAGGILWSQEFEDSDGLHIVASTPGGNDVDRRVVATDANGKMRVASATDARSVTGIWQLIVTFQDLRREDIKEFQYQVRAYQMTKFVGVSLQPGQKTEVRIEVQGPSAPSGAGSAFQPSGISGTSDARANIFVISPPAGFNVFNAVIARAEDWAWNRTGRNHSKQAYDQIFDGTNNRTDHDVLVLLFSLDREDRIPAGYEDLLPEAWPQIERQLRQGKTVDLSGQARGLNVILLAAPRAEQLEQVIAGSQFLVNPQGMLGQSGKGCDIAIQSFSVRQDPDRGTFRARVAIRNIGRVASPRFLVRYCLGDLATARPMIQGAGPLKPNELFQVGSSDFALKEGINEIDVAADPADLVEELDETNNRATLRVVIRDGQIVEQSAVSSATWSGDPDQAARAKAAEILGNLGRAMLIYANEHGGELPDGVENVEDELDPLDKEWLLQNAAYLGKGLSARDAPGRVVAYDRTLLAKGDGTNVLYLDTHVKFEEPEALKRLGVEAAAGKDSSPVFGGYVVNRSVADFPAGEDFSTPEAAYATVNRMDQGDPSAWRKVSAARTAARIGGSGSEAKRAVDPEWAKILANARIKEVLVWNMTRAAVIAELPQELSSKKIVEPFDRRSFELENGRWLNTGNGRFNSIEEAKAQFTGWMKRETSQSDAMRDPLAHADEIKAAAAQLFEQLRTADYAKILSYYRDGKWVQDGWKKLPITYTVHTDYPSFTLWCATHFKDNPIVDVQLGDVFIGDALVLDKTGWPTVPYKLTLKDGSILAGNLPFQYTDNRGRKYWHPMEGIDWHLWPNGTK